MRTTCPSRKLRSGREGRLDSGMLCGLGPRCGKCRSEIAEQTLPVCTRGAARMRPTHREGISLQAARLHHALSLP